jgi:hypothetical protein
MAAPFVKPEQITACLEETKALLRGVCERIGDQRLRTCILNMDKIEALLKGDYEAVWLVEAEQRRRDIAFQESVIANLRIIQDAKLEAAKHQYDNTPLLAALRAMDVIRCRPQSPPLPPVPPAPTHTDGDEDLYR